MRALEFAFSAREDLGGMLRYGTHHWGERRAQAFLEQFFADLDILRVTPTIGRRDGPDYVWPYRQYLIRYSFTDDMLTVISVVPKNRPVR